MMETLLALPFFTSLPGSARVQLIDTLMTMLARESVWTHLGPEGESLSPLLHVDISLACITVIINSFATRIRCSLRLTVSIPAEA